MSLPAALRDDAAQVARLGRDRLASMVGPRGRFTYAVDASGAALPGYNLLRHAGACWALARLGADAEAPLRYLMTQKTAAVGDSLCITGRGDSAKLGGAGLALLAISAGDGWEPQGHALARFILALRRKDGDFHHKIALPSRAVLLFRSDYYTGEALVGLSDFHHRTGERAYQQAALASVLALGARDYGVAEQSHWMIYALRSLTGQAFSRELWGYGERIITGILADKTYRQRGMSTPIACRVEALATGLPLVQSADIRAAAVDRLTQDVSTLLRFHDGAGGMWRDHGRARIQIDYIQHAAMGLSTAAQLD